MGEVCLHIGRSSEAQLFYTLSEHLMCPPAKSGGVRTFDAASQECEKRRRLYEAVAAFPFLSNHDKLRMARFRAFQSWHSTVGTHHSQSRLSSFRYTPSLAFSDA